MTKIDKLHRWLLKKGEWLYLSQVPHEKFEMSKQTCHTALTSLCNYGCAQFRIVGLKQYKALDAQLPTRGRPREQKRPT